MVRTVPKWVVDDPTAVKEEAALYREMTPAQRAVHLALACRAMARIVAARADGQQVLNHEDPLPESTVLILKRLQRK